MITRSLHDSNWTLQAVGDLSLVPDGIREQTIKATVPGCVHTDLMAAGLIPDPYVGMNELDLLWIGRTDWRYVATFDVDADTLAHDRVDVVCEGLDTLAELRLNGEKLGEADNMHIRRRFNAKPLLRAGANTLSITFAAALPYAEAMEERFGELPVHGGGSNPQHPHNFIRKMACNFGWDWGPVVVTAGVWRPIRLEAWSGARFGDVRPLVTRADEERAVIDLRVQTEAAADPGPIDIGYSLRGPDGRRLVCDPIDGAVAGSLVQTTITVDRPRLWWPAGHGDQPLYELKIKLKDERGDTVQEVVHRIGLRTSELVTEPDPAPFDGLGRGAGMTLKVNGKPIYCKGANWVPDDCFPHRVTAQRYRDRIHQALGANMNMLRVWGGGVYESDTFYEACDELGVMVWQDFCCACACYSEEGPFPAQFEAEARDNVSRLSRRPSLVIWNGCNENFMGYTAWNYKGRPWHEFVDGRGWGSRYYLDTFPAVIDEIDPTKPYWPGSPYSGIPDVFQRDANANEFGNRHIWDVWHGPGQYRNYLAHFPRFSSEFGFHGPPCWPTLERVIPPDQRRWNSDAMKLHNKNGRPGQEQTRDRMCDDFVPPDDRFDDWLYLAQVMQARALSMGVEWFRALFPWNSGALYWQLNDAYPVSSWSAIDNDGRAKPLLFASRRFFADRLVTIKTRGVAPQGEPMGALAVYFHNDHDEVWSGQCVLRKMSLDGQTLQELRKDVEVAPRSLERFDVPDDWREQTEDAFLVVDMGDARNEWWFAPDKELAYPDADFEASLETDGRVKRLTVRARSLMRDICVFPDRIDPDATINDQCVTLLPGEVFVFEIVSDAAMTLEQLTRPPVMQSVNRFGAKMAAVSST